MIRCDNDGYGRMWVCDPTLGDPIHTIPYTPLTEAEARDTILIE